MANSPELNRLQQRAKSLQRWRPGSEDALNAKRAAATLALEEYVRRVVDAAPPLTDDQVAYLSTLFRPTSRSTQRHQSPIGGEQDALAA